MTTAEQCFIKVRDEIEKDRHILGDLIEEMTKVANRIKAETEMLREYADQIEEEQNNK